MDAVLQLTLVLGMCSMNLIPVKAQPLVDVEQGTLMGKTVQFSEQEFINVNREIRAYEGVPYAEPPSRFERPEKKAPWNGVWDATYPRSACIQDPASALGLPISEDCLYLNIYVPSGVRDAAVMVFIHGGGFTSGSGYPYNGVPLSSVGDVIVINMNYRLSTLGFLTTGDDILPGNYAMLDQVEALRWIKQNVAAFGGDEDNITIFGESAGSASVHHHTISKLSRGLFSKAIMQSGAALSVFAFQDPTLGKTFAFQVGATLGCTGTTSLALRQCLLQASAEEVYNAGTQVGFFAAPTIDGYFLDGKPGDLISQGDFERLPIMLGTTADEGTYALLTSIFAVPSPSEPFVFKQVYEEFVSSFAPNQLIKDAYFQQYLDWSIQDQDGLDYFRPLVDLFTDWFYVCPHDTVARAYANTGTPVYQYLFTHTPSSSIWTLDYGQRDWLGASHAEEIQFVFGNPFASDSLGLEKKLSVDMMRYWTEFAKSGAPSASTDPKEPIYWPRFTIPELEYKVLDVNMTTGRALRADFCHFLNELVPRLTTFISELPAAEQEWKTEFSNWKYQAMADWQDAFNAYRAATRDARCDADGCK